MLTHFLPTLGWTIVVADELDDRFEPVHEAGRNQPILLQVAADGPGDDDEQTSLRPATA